MTGAMGPPRARVRAIRVAAVSALLAGVVIAGSPAYACSCAAGEPRDALADADAALVGVVVDTSGGPIGGLFGGSIYGIEVQHDLKGNLTERIDVDGGAANDSCGLGLQDGERVGLLIDGSSGHWRASLCSTMEPRVLLSAAERYPAPDGEGPIRFLIGGGFGEVRVIALDAEGRTLAYGAGGGDSFALDACPAGGRFVEGARIDGRAVLVVRETSSLEPIREVSLGLGGYGDVYDLVCLDRRGHHLLAIAGIDRLTQVFDVVGTDVQLLLDDRTTDAWIQGDEVFVVRDGRISCVPESAAACVRPEVSVPSASFGFRWSPDGTHLAGFRYGDDVEPEQASQVVVIEASTGRLETFDLGGSNFVGDVSWIDDDTIVYLPGGGDDDGGHVLHLPGMQPVGRIHTWYTARSVVMDGRAYGVGWGELMWVDLPSGDVHQVQVVGDTYALEVLGGHIVADPQPPPEPDLRSDVGSDDVEQVVEGSPLPWIAAGVILTGSIMILSRRHRRASA